MSNMKPWSEAEVLRCTTSPAYFEAEHPVIFNAMDTSGFLIAAEALNGRLEARAAKALSNAAVLAASPVATEGQGSCFEDFSCTQRVPASVSNEPAEAHNVSLPSGKWKMYNPNVQSSCGAEKSNLGSPPAGAGPNPSGGGPSGNPTTLGGTDLDLDANQEPFGRPDFVYEYDEQGEHKSPGYIAGEARSPSNLEPIGGVKGGVRLRARSKVTNRACEALCRELGIMGALRTDGGKSSLFCVGDWTKHLYGSEVRLETLEKVQVEGPGPNDPTEWDFWIGLRADGHVALVSLRILARLVNLMAFRPRDRGSLGLLRARTLQYSKELHYAPERVVAIMHGTIAMAMRVPAIERQSMGLFQGSAGRDIHEQSDELRSGILVHGRKRHWWQASLAAVQSASIAAVGLRHPATAAFTPMLVLPYLKDFCQSLRLIPRLTLPAA